MSSSWLDYFHLLSVSAKASSHACGCLTGLLCLVSSPKVISWSSVVLFPPQKSWLAFRKHYTWHIKLLGTTTYCFSLHLGCPAPSDNASLSVKNSFSPSSPGSNAISRESLTCACVAQTHAHQLPALVEMSVCLSGSPHHYCYHQISLRILQTPF